MSEQKKMCFYLSTTEVRSSYACSSFEISKNVVSFLKILSFDNLTLTVKNLGPLFHPWHQHESKARAWKGLFIIFADPYPSNSIDQTSARVSLDINIAINSELSTAFNVPSYLSVKRLDSSMVLQLLIFSSIAIDVMKWWLLIIFAKRLY